MRGAFRHAVVLMGSALLLLAAVVTASASAGRSGPTNTGPDGAGAGAAASAAGVAAPMTNAYPVAQFPPSPAQAVYVPITPCRIIDTRGAGGRLQPGTTRNFVVRGTAGFAAQGGSASGCGIPEAATAVTVSVSATNIAGTGYFRAWPYGQTEPNATLAHYVAGPISTTGGTMTLGPASSPFDITMKAYGAGSSPVVDVTGYYESTTHLIILSDGSVFFGNSQHLVSLEHTFGTGSYTLAFDRTLLGCNVLTMGNGNASVLVGGSWGGSTLTVTTRLLSGGTLTLHDESFQVYLAC